MEDPKSPILANTNGFDNFPDTKSDKKKEIKINTSVVCSICGKTLSQKSSLNRHLKIHQGIKPYECSFHCGKTFSTASFKYFGRHELQHSNNKPFVCDVEDCFRSFKSASALQYHKKTHIGERNYVCTYHDCKKAFLSQSNLTKHMLTHTTAQLFFCPYCERQYKRRNDMMRHVRQKHNFTTDEPSPNAEQFSHLVEQNKKQSEIIEYLLERNKRLQDRLNRQMVNL